MEVAFTFCLGAEHVSDGKGLAKDFHRHGLPSLDRHRSRGRGAGRHILLQRAGHILAHILHHHPYPIHYRPKGLRMITDTMHNG